MLLPLPDFPTTAVMLPLHNLRLTPRKAGGGAVAGEPGFEDGAALKATFCQPRGVACDQEGNI